MGSFAKGVHQIPDEQYKSSSKLHTGDTAGHPGKPQDIMTGGVSWAGASPYNLIGDNDKPMAPVAPWPPSQVQIAGGKEPVQPSPLLKNFPPTEATTEPALHVTSKGNPHDPIDPDKKTMTITSQDTLDSFPGSNRRISTLVRTLSSRRAPTPSGTARWRARCTSRRRTQLGLGTCFRSIPPSHRA